MTVAECIITTAPTRVRGIQYADQTLSSHRGTQRHHLLRMHTCIHAVHLQWRTGGTLRTARCLVRSRRCFGTIAVHVRPSGVFSDEMEVHKQGFAFKTANIHG